MNDGTAGQLLPARLDGDFADADNFIGTFFQTPSDQFGLRRTRLIHVLLDKAEKETDPDARTALYEQANRAIMKFLPGVPYVHTKAALAFESERRGLRPEPVASEVSPSPPSPPAARSGGDRDHGNRVANAEQSADDDGLMLRFVVRRLLLLVPILLGLSILLFFWIRALPGGPAESLLGERATPEAVEQIERQYGLDRPIYDPVLKLPRRGSSRATSAPASRPGGP